MAYDDHHWHWRLVGAEPVGDSGVYRYAYGKPDPEDPWRRPTTPPRVISAQFQVGGPNMYMQLDQVIAAARIEWTLDGVQHVDYVLPGFVRETDPTSVSIWLPFGSDDCYPGFDLSILEEGARLTMTAIRHDGSEAPIVGVPEWLTPIVDPTPEPHELEADTWDIGAFANELVAFVTMQHLPSWLGD